MESYIGKKKKKKKGVRPYSPCGFVTDTLYNKTDSKTTNFATR